jgi:antitoxin PrlF
MATATLTSKGQMVIPKPIREYLHLHAGDNVDFLVQDNGDVLVRPAVEDVRHLKGILFKVGRKPVSLKTMQEAVRQRGARRQ